ncbi:MAG: type IV toxin-antitoxin system AbiEi family antitoxin domain-containing protein [Bdellovibrionales bacterium]|nr:type IV toxin-antitoxin system AbiEi family antitoxin domain-containing protein [Bdellovibrionales bacterium]
MKRKPTKDRLFLNWQDEAVHTHSWFESHGISRQAVYQCVKKKLIKKLGGGAYIKAKDKLNWQSAVLTAQKELQLPFHVAGQTALELQGLGHFVKMGKKIPVYIVNRDNMRVPIWLKNNNWGVIFHFRTSSLFPPDLGLMKYNRSKFHFILSSRERAIMEMVSHLELKDSFETLERYFEGLLNLRGLLVQKLLENCSSIKVKRVFLYMADKLKLPVMKSLNTRRIQLGQGKRVIIKEGKLDKTYNITVPVYDNYSN